MNGKSFSINIDKKNSNTSNLKLKYNKYLLSPSKSKTFVESKSQANIFTLKKNVKLSLNKYHQYIKNINNEKKTDEFKKPLSLYFRNRNKKNIINNNRNEIKDNYSLMTKYKSFYDKNSISSLSQTNRTLLLNNTNKNNYKNNFRHKKLNQLNIGINSQSTKNSSFMINYNSNINNNDTTLLTKFPSYSISKKKKESLNLKKLKNSKFFYRTKYVSWKKSKNIKNIKNSSFSTYNITFHLRDKNEIVYNTINEMINKQIMNKIKISKNEETNKICNIKQMINKKNSSIQTDIEKAKYLDFLPVILKHIKQKQTMDDIYGEYNQYLLNISKSTMYNNSNKKNIEGNGYKYPKIKYLFLENIINNLNHMVKFVNIKNNEELEQNVINIIRDEYSKIQNNNNEMNDIKDFLTYGYEYVPKRKSVNIFPQLKDIGQQVHVSNYINDNNKQSSIFFINEQKFDEIQISNKENTNDKISPTKNIYIKQRIRGKKRIFDKFNYKGRNQNNELKEDINSILSSYKTYDNKNDIFKTIDKKKINSLLKNEKLKTLNIFKKIPFKRKVKIKPKFIKINFKASKLNEDFKNNSSIKYDSSNKIDETLYPSTFSQKESKEKSDEKLDNLNSNNKDSEIKEAKDLKDEIVNENKCGGEKRKINNIKNLIMINEQKHIIHSEKKENINLNSNLENINNKEQKNEENKITIDIERLKNLFKNNEINNDDIDINIKKEIEENDGLDGDNDEEEEKSENSNEKDEDITSNISEKKEESSDNKNNKNSIEKEEKEKKDEVENLEKDINEEMKESENDNKKNKKLLKKKKTNKFLKSIENTLIALTQIENHAKQNPSKNKFMYNELMPSHRNLNDSNNEERENDSNSENKPKKNVPKNIFSPKIFEDKEISVSSLTNSSIGELEEFKKIKKTIQTKMKKKAFDKEKRKIQYKRRDALINPEIDIFKNAIKSKEISELNLKMKKIYDNINKEKKKEENKIKKKRKKSYMFTFTGVDENDIKEIEKRKQVNLNRLKEEIKYKIIQGRFHVVDMYNYQSFSKAIMEIDFSKYKNNRKKLHEYIRAIEKYFQLFYNELLNREKQSNDEKRINKFLTNLKEEIGETIPLITNYKGHFCRSIDLNKEGDLSILNTPEQK